MLLLLLLLLLFLFIIIPIVISGIEEEDVERVVSEKLKEMALTEYADRAAGFYSGGNKRKLCVANALIGN